MTGWPSLSVLRQTTTTRRRSNFARTRPFRRAETEEHYHWPAKHRFVSADRAGLSDWDAHFCILAHCPSQYLDDALAAPREATSTTFSVRSETAMWTRWTRPRWHLKIRHLARQP